MPRDASGDFTLPTNDASPAAPRNVIRSSDFNELMTDIAEGLTDSLSRSGDGEMLADLDMGGFNIVNAGTIGSFADLTGTIAGAQIAPGLIPFDTKLDAEASDVPTSIATISLYGEDASGDAGVVSTWVETTEDASPLKSYQFKTNINTKRWALSDRDVDIRSIGCKTDALFDENSGRLQDLIDAKSGYGGRIIIPATEDPFILIDEDTDGYFLRIKSGTEIVGAAQNATLKAAPMQAAWTAGIKVNASQEAVILKGFTYDGNRYNQADQSSRLGIAGSSFSKNVSLADMIVKDVSSRGIITNEDGDLVATNDFAEAWHLYNVRVLNSGEKGIQFRSTRWGSATGCYVTTDYRGDGTASSFEASNSQDIAFAACNGRHFTGDQGPGFRFVNNSKRVIATGGTITGGRQSLVVIDAQSCKFIGITSINALAGALISSADIDALSRDITRDILIDGFTCINPANNGVDVTVVDGGTGVVNCRILNSYFFSDLAAPSLDYGIRNAGDLNALGRPTDVREWGNTFVGAKSARKTGVLGGMADSLNADSYTSGSVTLLDDTVAIIPAPNGGNSGIIEVTVQSVQAWSAKGMYRSSGTANMTQLYNGIAGRINFFNTPLAGTTGDDTDLNIGVDTSGNIYIENRAGATRRIDYTITNAT